MHVTIRLAYEGRYCIRFVSVVTNSITGNTWGWMLVQYWIELGVTRVCWRIQYFSLGCTCIASIAFRHAVNACVQWQWHYLSPSLAHTAAVSVLAWGIFLHFISKLLWTYIVYTSASLTLFNIHANCHSHRLCSYWVQAFSFHFCIYSMLMPVPVNLVWYDRVLSTPLVFMQVR